MVWVSAALWVVTGCTGPSYSDVQRADTIEAYEAFLEADPETFYRNPIEKRLEELYWKKANEADNLAGWAEYTARWEGTKAKNYPLALKKHAAYAWQAAIADGSLPAIEKYADEFGKADRVLADRARGMIAAKKYGLQLGEPRVEKVNLAEDPEGPLNGWGVFVDVTNTGQETLHYVRLSVQWLNEDGSEIATKDYPLVSDRWQMPATEEQQTPIGPGETRTWEWTEDFSVVPDGKPPGHRVFPSGFRTEPAK